MHAQQCRPLPLDTHGTLLSAHCTPPLHTCASHLQPFSHPSPTTLTLGFPSLTPDLHPHSGFFFSLPHLHPHSSPSLTSVFYPPPPCTCSSPPPKFCCCAHLPSSPPQSLPGISPVQRTPCTHACPYISAEARSMASITSAVISCHQLCRNIFGHLHACMCTIMHAPPA